MKIHSILKIGFIITLFFCFSFKISCYELDELEIKQDYQKDGVSLTVKYPEPKDEEIVSVFYRSFNPFADLYSNGKIPKDENLFFVFGTHLCIWAQSSSGKMSKPFHLVVERPEQKKLLNVLSPKEGVWNEAQQLIIKTPPGTQIIYSVDGSDPQEFGLLYTGPIRLEKEGEVELRIKAVSESGSVDEKIVKYEVSPSGLSSPKIPETALDENLFEKNSEYNILNWYFLEFNSDLPVYYLIKEKEEPSPEISHLLNIYDGPVFIDRSKDCVFYWTKTKEGKINGISLPKKPSLSPVPAAPVNRNIELKFDDERYDYFFETGDGCAYIDPTMNSFKFKKDASYTFDLGLKEERFFDVKIKAFYDGIFHGDFQTSFTIDKLPPEIPEVSFNPPLSATNSSVKIKIKTPSDNRIITEIEPPIFTSSNGEIILTGVIGEKTVYSVNIYSKDEAGNRSAGIKKEFTIDRNAVYVDNNSKVKNPDGNPSKPFSTIYEAVKYINRVSLSKKNETGSEKWKIYIRGDCILNEAVLITRNIKITSAAQKTSIHFSKNSGFVVIGANFEVENCNIFRRERLEEPREVPIIYADKAGIKLNNVKIQAFEGGAVLNSFYSHLDISDSKIISDQKRYCLIFNLNNSSAVFQNLEFEGTGFSVAAISSSNSIIELDNINASFNSGFTARFLEAWNSEISLGRLNLIRLPETAQNKDTAVWYNKNSKLDIKFNPLVRGFLKSIEREP
ncbi:MULTISPECIES: chitobiase/beta-hexosaminidase C-terminal domain-containing protein [unclassified Treponema]|uniref:chitobiase/beta-hexosaminidase C-terminal domain-containing protein n=1 Tax=unclassified Treponema TaxID=2638727 RepID=UPI0020A2A093|nr:MULTISPECIES: chitobiase/beta-hexosaminidase C-terminal domain-containing protein [unclassified Treponema]